MATMNEPIKSTGMPAWNFRDPATHDHLKALREPLSTQAEVASIASQDMARGYAWGRIDSAGYTWPAHGGDALDFCLAYAIHALEPKMTHAVREAFEAWHATGRITR